VIAFASIPHDGEERSDAVYVNTLATAVHNLMKSGSAEYQKS
jgi:hypothetical protein